MLLTEWNLKDALEVAREEAREEALAIAREEEREKAEIKGMEKILDYLKQGHTIEEAEALLKV